MSNFMDKWNSSGSSANLHKKSILMDELAKTIKMVLRLYPNVDWICSVENITNKANQNDIEINANIAEIYTARNLLDQIQTAMNYGISQAEVDNLIKAVRGKGENLR
ncbi:MAG: hypothetical protein IJK18_02940 [Clostridia bacterium]|nr:hypothetical protein [Clostridia bacterium]